MTKRKRPGAANRKKPSPAKPAEMGMEMRQEMEPPDSTAAETGTQMMAFRIPKAIANELRGASKVIDADQASILREALERELNRLRRKYNLGEPFPSVPTNKAHRSRRL